MVLGLGRSTLRANRARVGMRGILRNRVRISGRRCCTRFWSVNRRPGWKRLRLSPQPVNVEQFAVVLPLPECPLTARFQKTPDGYAGALSCNRKPGEPGGAFADGRTSTATVHDEVVTTVETIEVVASIVVDMVSVPMKPGTVHSKDYEDSGHQFDWKGKLFECRLRLSHRYGCRFNWHRRSLPTMQQDMEQNVRNLSAGSADDEFAMFAAGFRDEL